MSTLRDRGSIRPKISTMPRQQSEASMQLEIYRLVTEKQRLENELQLMEQRRHQVHQRLGVLGNEIAKAEQKIQQMRYGTADVPHQQSSPPPVPTSPSFNTFDLEY